MGVQKRRREGVYKRRKKLKALVVTAGASAEVAKHTLQALNNFEMN